jgi:uncharacterized membrane protein
MASWEEHLQRWETVGVVDPATAERVRKFESQIDAPAERRWQIAVLLSLGIIMLVGGLMLFVASHWDQVGPWQRLSLVMGFLTIFHVLAVISAKRFPGMATALHGVGTAGAGAAILTVGQIFNMQEHWPTAVLLWALCAGAGWWLLRDQVQKILTLLLISSWLVCEWSFRADGYAFASVYAGRMAVAIAVAMLTGLILSRQRGVFWTLYITGALGLISSVGMLSEGWVNWSQEPIVPVSLRVGAAVIIAIICVGGWLWERKNLIPILTFVLISYLLPWRPVCSVPDQYSYNGVTGVHDEPSALMYLMVAIATVVLAWWGLKEKSRAIVNYAVIAFGLTVLWFYSASLMNKIGRSLGLIGLGILFLAGGWVLEKLRRKLMVGIRETAA